MEKADINRFSNKPLSTSSEPRRPSSTCKDSEHVWQDHPRRLPRWLRIYTALLVSALGFTAYLGAALINPAFVPMSNDLAISVKQASYCTTTVILLGGISALFIVPFANVYGRRLMYVIFTAIAAAGAFASAGAGTYGGVIAGRVVNGIGGSVPLGLGAATICDLFEQGERGLYMGICKYIGKRLCLHPSKSRMGSMVGPAIPSHKLLKSRTSVVTRSAFSAEGEIS